MRPDDRIRRLLNTLTRITTARGATSHEAEAALARIAALRETYGVEHTRTDSYSVVTRPWFRGRNGHRRAGRVPVTRYVLPGIQARCGVVAFWDAGDGTLSFFGDAAACEHAHEWQTVVGRAVDTAYKAYAARAPRKAGETGASRAARFRRAMAERVNQRLLSAPGCPVHAAAVRRAFDAAYTAVTRAGSGAPDDPQAVDAGNRVVLAPEIEGPA